MDSAVPVPTAAPRHRRYQTPVRALGVSAACTAAVALDRAVSGETTIVTAGIASLVCTLALLGCVVIGALAWARERASVLAGGRRASAGRRLSRDLILSALLMAPIGAAWGGLFSDPSQQGFEVTSGAIAAALAPWVIAALGALELGLAVAIGRDAFGPIAIVIGAAAVILPWTPVCQTAAWTFLSPLLPVLSTDGAFRGTGGLAWAVLIGPALIVWLIHRWEPRA